jgi:hypothetical protein
VPYVLAICDVPYEQQEEQNLQSQRKVTSQHEVYVIGVTSHSNKFKCVNKKKGNRLPQLTLTCCLMAILLRVSAYGDHHRLSY